MKEQRLNVLIPKLISTPPYPLCNRRNWFVTLYNNSTKTKLRHEPWAGTAWTKAVGVWVLLSDIPSYQYYARLLGYIRPEKILLYHKGKELIDASEHLQQLAKSRKDQMRWISRDPVEVARRTEELNSWPISESGIYDAIVSKLTYNEIYQNSTPYLNSLTEYLAHPEKPLFKIKTVNDP